MQGASVDWVFSDELQQWIVGLDGPNSQGTSPIQTEVTKFPAATRLYFWNEGLTELLGTVDVPGTWTEGKS